MTSEGRVREASIEAGALAGLAGLAVFLVIHHLLIAPIWFIAPMGAIMAAVGGAAVGAAFGEVRLRLPRRPWTILAVMAGVIAILAPSVVIAEILGPIYVMGADGRGRLLVSAPTALIAIGLGLIATMAAGALIGGLVGRTRRAAALTALAALALAVGPGHNIPMLGGTSGAMKGIVILVIVITVSSVVLVEAQALADRRDTGDPSRMRT